VAAWDCLDERVRNIGLVDRKDGEYCEIFNYIQEIHERVVKFGLKVGSNAEFILTEIGFWVKRLGSFSNWLGFYMDVIKTADSCVFGEGISVGHAHFRYIEPFPKFRRIIKV